MKILYQETGTSLLKGVLYAELVEGELQNKAEYEPSLFAGPVIEADDLDIEELIIKTRELKKRPGLFSRPGDLKAFTELVNWALRHRSPQKVTLIISVLKQAFHQGLPLILAGRSKLSRRFLALAEEVQAEVRLSGYQMKFQPLPHTKNIIFVRYCLEHKTQDLVLKKWTHVYPEYTFLFLLPDKSILGNSYGYKELGPLKGRPEDIGKKIMSYCLASYPNRSSLISHHADYVAGNQQRAGLQLALNKNVNYIDFYNKIKRGELL